MRVTTGEVISYDKKIELGYNHKKNAVKIQIPDIISNVVHLF